MGSAEVSAPGLLPAEGARVGKPAQSQALGLDFQCGSVMSQNSGSQSLPNEHLPSAPPSLVLHASDSEGLL